MPIGSKTDYAHLTAGEVNELASKGDCSAREVVEFCIDRLESLQNKINAIAVPLYEQARADADHRDAAARAGRALGPLHGVPITIKESFDVQGTPTTLGLPSRRNHVAVSDSPIVAQLRQAGAVILGKTNVPQLVVGNECANPLYGRTNNPWNFDRTAGGSSGGEAAALAVGGSFLGIGSDLGGSIRLPASACGVHGFKPTSGRFSMKGHGNVFGGQPLVMAQPGPLARSVADLALALGVLNQGNDCVVPWRNTAEVSVRKLRFAYYVDDGLLAASPALRRAVIEAAGALRAMGAEVEEWRPPNLVEMWQTYSELLLADGLAHFKRLVKRDPMSEQVRQFVTLMAIPDCVLPLLRKGFALTGQRIAGYSVGAFQAKSVDGYWQLAERREQLCEAFLRALDEKRFDGILCPPDAVPALPHGASQYVAIGLSYSALYNFLGMPAGVVAATRVRPEEETDRPLSRDQVERAAKKSEAGSRGLPVGVQVVARHWREDVALATMACLENFFKTKEDYPLAAQAQPSVLGRSALA